MKLDAKIPEGPLAEKWDNHRFNLKLVNPANKKKFKIIISLLLDNCSYSEIAEITGISISNVGVRINRLKKALTKKLK